MKAILVFNLPKEEEEFTHTKKGILYGGIIDDIRNELRNVRKYDVKPEVALQRIDEIVNETLV